MMTYGPDTNDPMDPVNTFGFEPDVFEVMGYDDDDIGELHDADRAFVESLTDRQRAGLSRLLYRNARREEESDAENDKALVGLVIGWLFNPSEFNAIFLPDGIKEAIMEAVEKETQRNKERT